MRIITPQDAAFTPSGPLTPAQTVAVLDQTIQVTGDIAAVPATFWTPSSPNELAAAYMWTMYAEIFNTTLNAGCTLVGFTLLWTDNGAPGSSAALSLALDEPISGSQGAQIMNADNNTAVQWQIQVGGWTSGAGTLRVKASLLRLA